MLSSEIPLTGTREIDGIFDQLYICFAPDAIGDSRLPGHSYLGLRSTRCSGQQTRRCLVHMQVAPLQSLYAEAHGKLAGWRRKTGHTWHDAAR